MRARGSIRVTAAAAVLTALLSPVVANTAPAGAHPGTYTSIADNGDADRTVTGINSTTVKARVLRPSTDALRPTNGWPLVVYMAGDLKNRCANINDTATRASWYTRTQMAEHGFAVLSFNARGYPALYNAGFNPTGTTGCDALDDSKDTIEKTAGVPDTTGWDLGGPLDRQDIDDLIEWAVNTYTSTGCTSPCIDGSKVGIVGNGADAAKALHMAVPAATNPQFNTRVKGVVAIGYGEHAVRNVKDVSSDGTNWRDADLGTRVWVPDANGGTLGTSDPGVYKHTNELLASKYLNTTVPTATTSWFDDRTLLDDTGSVDRIADIASTMPVFMANAFQDTEAGTTTATLAYKKLTSTNKYLYLGACGSPYNQLAATAGGPCQGTNATNLRNRVHDFLDRWIAGDTTISVGGPVFWAVPPATTPLTNTNWGEATDPIATWPPASTSSNTGTATYCLGYSNVTGVGTIHGSPCSGVVQAANDRDIGNVIEMPGLAWCTSSTYGATEVATYTGTADPLTDYKLIGFEADLQLKTTTTRLQVYADLFAVTPGTTETETRIWQGSAQVVPVVRNATPTTTVYRFKFKPSGSAWTLKAGDKLRLKVSSAYKKAFAQELLPATYTIKHTDTNPSEFRITFDL